jgi:CBS-domain-containing membrane protein
MSRRHIKIDEAGPFVADVMMPSPHTHPADMTVGEARQAFEKRSLKLMVVTDQSGQYVGTVARDTIPDDARDDATLATVADRDGLAFRPDDPTKDALASLEHGRAERVPVIDADGALAGLVCLNNGSDHFCA